MRVVNQHTNSYHRLCWVQAIFPKDRQILPHILLISTPPEQDEVNDPAESVLMIMIMMMPSKNIPTPLVLVEPWLLDQEARINLPHVP